MNNENPSRTQVHIEGRKKTETLNSLVEICSNLQVGVKLIPYLHLLKFVAIYKLKLNRAYSLSSLIEICSNLQVEVKPRIILNSLNNICNNLKD